MKTLPHRQMFLAALCLMAAVALPFFVPVYYAQLFTKIFIMAILAMGLNLVVGYGGMVSLCHGALFGLAGYTLALATPRYDPAAIWWTLPLAMAVAALAALLIGTLALRTRGIYFIMVTLAFGEMLFFLFFDTSFAGGSDGIFINTKPEVAIAGWHLLDLENPLTFYFVVLAVLATVIVFLDILVRSPFGHALIGARDNERRMQALGFPVFRIRLIAFVVSGALAGLAGYFAAAQFGYVAPQMLGWHASATVLVMILIGGTRSVTAPLIGAVVLLGLEEGLKVSTDHWKLIVGVVVIALVIFLPDGLRQILRHLGGARAAKPVAEARHDG